MCYNTVSEIAINLITFVFQAIQLIHLLFAQCSIDIFFIDWERPRVRASSVNPRAATTSKNVTETSVDTKKGLMKATPDKINTEMAGVSIWRTYYAANEWAEMQSQRKISLCLQLFGVLFVLKVGSGLAAFLAVCHVVDLLCCTRCVFVNPLSMHFSQHCIGGFKVYGTIVF